MSMWLYGYSRKVSAGMKCLPWLSPNTITPEGSQQSGTAQGYHRDDRIVRARAFGECGIDGSIQCTDGGEMFDICDQGGWVEMGTVAQGTICVGDGQIIVKD